MLRQRFIVAAIALASLPRLNGQVLDPEFAWGDAPVWDTAWDQGRTIDSEILADELSLRIRNVKPEYIAFFFERRRVVRFTKREDINRYGPVVLPESLDPPYDELGKPYARLDTRPYPLLFNLRVDHFAARVIRPDGSWTELPVATRGAYGYLGNPVNFQAAMSSTHYPQGIMPGDVVEYRWKYMLPWDTNAPHTLGWRGSIWMDNWARLTNWRIFFHHGLPIREQRVELRYHAKHGLEMAGAPPALKQQDGNDRRAVWEHRDLPGVMDEVGARPADELPCIIIAFAPDDLRNLRRERLSNLPITQQPWLQAIRQREAKAMWWRRVAQKKLPDRQNRQIKAFIRETCAAIPDTLKARRMEAIHERIARDFDYDADRDWYFDLDRSLARMGDQVRDERLRDISRYDLYSKLLNAESNDHVTAYLLDTRSGRLDDRFTTPMRDNEWLFGIRDGKSMLWMHPKRQRHGWFANELPFYWEGTNVLLIDLPRLIADDPRPPLFVELPASDPAGNIRGIEHQLRIDLEKRDAEGEARIFLSGQFSTLGRAAFLGGLSDSSAHPNYGHVPAMLPGAQARCDGEPELSSDAPFRYRERQQLRLKDFSTPEPGDRHAFELAPFFAHAASKGFKAEGRDSPFHWDFQQNDRFIIDFEFAQPVEVMDLTQLQGEWNAPSARYTLRVTRIDARHLRIESQLHVLEEMEAPEDALALETLLREVLAPSRMLRVRVSAVPEQ
jgi:hypothetical protein